MQNTRVALYGNRLDQGSFLVEQDAWVGIVLKFEQGISSKWVGVTFLHRGIIAKIPTAIRGIENHGRVVSLANASSSVSHNCNQRIHT